MKMEYSAKDVERYILSLEILKTGGIKRKIIKRLWIWIFELGVFLIAIVSFYIIIITGRGGVEGIRTYATETLLTIIILFFPAIILGISISRYGMKRVVRLREVSAKNMKRTIALSSGGAVLGIGIARGIWSISRESGYIYSSIAFGGMILSTAVCIGIVSHIIFLINKYCPHLKNKKH